VRWLADECVAARLVLQLRRAAHDVSYVAEDSPGSLDESIIDLAMHEGRLLLTEDKDFGDLVFGLGRPVPGIILLRVSPERVSRRAIG
jgi:predicted nuclease of predicted toxin-antitoxin system